MKTSRLSLLAAGALVAMVGGCHSSARPAPPTVALALDRSGLDSVMGRQWDGDASPIPRGRPQSAWLIDFRNDSSPVFGVSIHVARGRRLLTFARVVRQSRQLPVWVTLDAAWLPPLRRGFRIASRCRYERTVDEQVLALVRYTDTNWFTDVRAAWRANPGTGRIEVADTRGLSCENEGWGG